MERLATGFLIDYDSGCVFVIAIVFIGDNSEKLETTSTSFPIKRIIIYFDRCGYGYSCGRCRRAQKNRMKESQRFFFVWKNPVPTGKLCHK